MVYRYIYFSTGYENYHRHIVFCFLFAIFLCKLHLMGLKNTACFLFFFFFFSSFFFVAVLEL